MLELQIRGMANLLRNTRPEIVNAPLRNFLRRVTTDIQNQARMLAPVDVGGLRNRILTEIDPNNPPLWGKTGILNAGEGSSLWRQGRAMEFGTGRMGDPEVSHGGDHWPPPAALQVWATRHGFKDGPGTGIWSTAGGKVARIIGRRGGLVPRPFLRPAVRWAMSRMDQWLTQLGNEIKSAWEQGSGD